MLYDDKGKIYSSPYYSLGTKTYISDSIFWGEQTSSDIFAEFSMPRTGENHRGYISYMTEEVQDGYILDSWVSYTHQRTWLQYPVRTAAQHRMTSSASGAGAFFSVDDTFQFDPNHIEESDG